MQYFGAMKEKYGFDDGGSCPTGVEIYRDVYVKAINRLAELNGSDQRIVPYNRPGVHNVYMVWLVTKEWFDAVFLPRQEKDDEWETVEYCELHAHGRSPDTEADDAMVRAIDDAYKLNLDSYIYAKFRVDSKFDELLKSKILLNATTV